MASISNSLLWKFLERLSYQAVYFIVSIILARILEPVDYGYIALVMVFISIANVIIEGGLNSALIQKKNADIKDFSTILYVTISLSILIYLILFVAAPAIGRFYKNDELISVMRVLGLTLFTGAVNSVLNAYLSKYLLFRKLFISSFSAVILSAIVGISLAYLGFGIWALVFQHLIMSFTTMVVMWCTTKLKLVAVISLTKFKSLFDYGWKILASNLITSLFVNIRSLIIGKYYNSSSLAFFDRGNSLPSLTMESINSSIQSVMFSVLSDKQDCKGELCALIKKTTQLSSFVIFPMLVGLYVVAEPLIEVLLTSKWMQAVPFVKIFCIAYMMMPIQNINIVAIKALGYSNITLRLEIIKKVIEVLILIISVQINVIAIAWGVVVYNAVCVFINLYPIKKRLGYSYLQQFLDILPSLILSLSMGVCVYLLKYLCLNPLIQLVASIIMGILIYWLLSAIIKYEPYKYLLKALKDKILTKNR